MPDSFRFVVRIQAWSDAATFSYKVLTVHGAAKAVVVACREFVKLRDMRDICRVDVEADAYQEVNANGVPIVRPDDIADSREW